MLHSLLFSEWAHGAFISPCAAYLPASFCALQQIQSMVPTGVCSASRIFFLLSSHFLAICVHFGNWTWLTLSSLCHFCPPGFSSFVAVHRCLAGLALLTRSSMMRFALLVCMARFPLSLLLMLQLLRLVTVLMKVSFHVSHIVLLWFFVMVMLRFLSVPRCFWP